METSNFVSDINVSCHRNSGILYISDSVKVSEFRDNWLTSLSQLGSCTLLDDNETAAKENEPFNYPQSLLDLPDIPEDLRKELAKKCSVSTLNCEGEAQLYEYASKKRAQLCCGLPNVPKNVSLATLKFQEKDLAKRWENVNYRDFLRFNNMYITLEQYQSDTLSSNDVNQEFAVDPTDVILSVMVCSPSKGYVKKCLTKGGVKYIVLGSQRLTDLRDKIGCITDIMVPGDFSFNPCMPIDTRAKDLYKSGFFYINGVFYNDMRDPTSRDYSKVIIDWAQNDPSRKMGPYTTQKMEETTFMELDIKLGYPYVYVHQGDCEHLLVFIDLRLVNSKDCQNRKLYPICCWSRRKKRTQCMTCHLCTAKWVVQNNPRLPTDPFFFCDSCFQSFNYTKDNNKIGEFTAHPYLDKVAMI